MDNVAIGTAALKGWREKVADTVATPVAKRSAFSEDQVRAVIGVVFLALSLLYVTGAIRRIASQT